MRLTTLGSIAILAVILAVITVPAYAIKFSSKTSSGSGEASVSGEYLLTKSASLDSDIVLGQGAASRQSSASGSGNNLISEGASGEGKSVTNTISSNGAFTSSNNDFASSKGAASNYEASLTGSSGSFSVISTGNENEFAVAGKYSGEANMDVSLTSLAAQEALTTGSVLALGTPIFSDGLAQTVHDQDMDVIVQGLYKASEQGLGEFGMVAQNAKIGGVAAKPRPPTNSLDYKLLGVKWPSNAAGPEIGIALSTASEKPNGSPGLDDAKIQISAALGTWDAASSKQIFSASGLGSTPASGMLDSQNVHLWTSDKNVIGDDNIIAMTSIYYNRFTRHIVDADCWYNNRLTWRTNGDYPTSAGYFDIQTIALHELGHTIGLGDLYTTDRNYKPSWKEQTMWGYDDGTSDHTLAGGDIAGVQALYGV